MEILKNDFMVLLVEKAAKDKKEPIKDSLKSNNKKLDYNGPSFETLFQKELAK